MAYLEVIKTLIKVAETLDSKNLTVEADIIDKTIEKICKFAAETYVDQSGITWKAISDYDIRNPMIKRQVQSGTHVYWRDPRGNKTLLEAGKYPESLGGAGKPAGETAESFQRTKTEQPKPTTQPTARSDAPETLGEAFEHSQRVSKGLNS